MLASQPQICGGQSGTGFLRALRCSPVYIIPPKLHTHLHLHVALTRKTNGRSLGTIQKARLFRKSGSIEQKRTSTVFKGLINTAIFLMIAKENIRHSICLSSFLYGIQYCCDYNDTKASVQNFQPCGNFSRSNK